MGLIQGVLVVGLASLAFVCASCSSTDSNLCSSEAVNSVDPHDVGSIREAPGSWTLLLPDFVDQPWRSDGVDGFVIAGGDFDGDGRQDVARLLVDRSRQRCAVVVSFGQHETREQEPALVLDESCGASWKIAGIRTGAPGAYQTACGKGYFECLPGEPEHVVATNEVIIYFLFEKVESALYWNPAMSRFDRIWLSD